jgi:hypothetical protein
MPPQLLHTVWLHSQLTFPQSPDWANPDRVQFGTKSGIGAASTFNHLTDAILDVEATRLMYFRRLRTLADKYYGQGKLRQVRSYDTTSSGSSPNLLPGGSLPCACKV